MRFWAWGSAAVCWWPSEVPEISEAEIKPLSWASGPTAKKRENPHEPSLPSTHNAWLSFLLISLYVWFGFVCWDGHANNAKMASNQWTVNYMKDFINENSLFIELGTKYLTDIIPIHCYNISEGYRALFSFSDKNIEAKWYGSTWPGPHT